MPDRTNRRGIHGRQQDGNAGRRVTERAIPDDRLGRADPTGMRAEVAAIPPGEGDSAPQPLGRRFLRPETFVSFAIAIAILYFAVRGLRIDPAAVWTIVRRADPWFLLAALAVWYGIFVAGAPMAGDAWPRRRRSRPRLRRTGLGGLYEILLLSWFATASYGPSSATPTGANLLKRESRAPFSTGLGTVVAERLTDLLVLCIAMAAAGVLVFGRRLPPRRPAPSSSASSSSSPPRSAWAPCGYSAIPVNAGSRAHSRPVRPAPRRHLRLPPATAAGADRGPRDLLGEGLRFWLVSRSLEAPLPFAVALFIALMGALLTTIPVTPAGLGVVEAAPAR
jgi:hypothetical protein